MQNNENREGDPTFPYLDEAITKDEIQTAIRDWIQINQADLTI